MKLKERSRREWQTGGRAIVGIRTFGRMAGWLDGWNLADDKQGNGWREGEGEMKAAQ